MHKTVLLQAQTIASMGHAKWACAFSVMPNAKCLAHHVWYVGAQTMADVILQKRAEFAQCGRKTRSYFYTEYISEHNTITRRSSTRHIMMKRDVQRKTQNVAHTRQSNYCLSGRNKQIADLSGATFVV